MDWAHDDPMRPPSRRLRKLAILLTVPALAALGAALPLILEPGSSARVAEWPSVQRRSLGHPEAVVRWAPSWQRSGATTASVLIPGVPHIRQKPDFCGEACVAMFLRKLGHQVSQDDVFAKTGVDPAAGRGAWAPELVRALRHFGFEPGRVWTHLDREAPQQDLDEQWLELHQDLQQGISSIVCMHYSDAPETTEHFRLVLGYDGLSDSVLYHEPAEDHGALRRMARSMFLKLWPLHSRKHGQTVIRMRLALGSLKPAPAPVSWSDADLRERAAELEGELPEGFIQRVEPPFVVAGDGSAAAVRRQARGTVRWSVDQLKSLYFASDPEHILQIWLFRNRESYRHHTAVMFDERPDTPYGYYSPRHRALVMNIATGGGTLVHEIVHPFMAANFPDVPTWFNEGLASLYEQSDERAGRIVGLLNWRLPGLQNAIQAGTLRSLESLLGTTDDEFRGAGSGVHYAQARYLCLYLQEYGLLVRFYHAFWANRGSDPTGLHTLMQVLEVDDMATFQRHWERWVMGLNWSA